MQINIVASCFNAFTNQNKGLLLWSASGTSFLLFVICSLIVAAITFDSDVSHSLETTIDQQLAFYQAARSNCLLQETKPSSQFSPFGNLPLRSLLCGKFLYLPCNLNPMGLSLTLDKHTINTLDFGWNSNSNYRLWYKRKTPPLQWSVF